LPAMRIVVLDGYTLNPGADCWILPSGTFARSS
jgi:hypothetical protein